MPIQSRYTANENVIMNSVNCFDQFGWITQQESNSKKFDEVTWDVLLIILAFAYPDQLNFDNRNIQSRQLLDLRILSNKINEAVIRHLCDLNPSITPVISSEIDISNVAKTFYTKLILAKISRSIQKSDAAYFNLERKVVNTSGAFVCCPSSWERRVYMYEESMNIIYRTRSNSVGRGLVQERYHLYETQQVYCCPTHPILESAADAEVNCYRFFKIAFCGSLGFVGIGLCGVCVFSQAPSSMLLLAGIPIGGMLTASLTSLCVIPYNKFRQNIQHNEKAQSELDLKNVSFRGSHLFANKVPENIKSTLLSLEGIDKKIPIPQHLRMT